jgi:integrase
MASFSKADNGTWSAQVKKNGIRKFKRGFETKRAAQAWVLKTETDILEYQSDQIPNKPFSDAIRRYLETISIQKRGFEFERRRMTRWLGESDAPSDPLCFVLLADLQPKHFADWRDRRLKEVTPGTVLREWTILSAICNQCAKEWGWLRENPMSKVKRPDEPAARTRRISEEEYQRILIATGYQPGNTPKSVAQKVGAVFCFAIETAMRAGEICSLTWGDIDLERKTAYLAETKNGTSRVVPLSKQAVLILEGVKKMPPAKFAFDLKSASLDANFRKIKKQCMIDDLHFHDTRREAITRMAAKVDVMTLAKISGHKDLRILQGVYYAPDMSGVAGQLD